MLRFRTVLLLHMGLLVVLVVGAATLAISVVLDRAARRDRAEDLIRARGGLRELMAHLSALHDAQADLVAEEPRLKAVVATEGMDRATVADVADELRRALGGERLVVVDGEGRLLADSGRPGGLEPGLAADPLLTRALAGEAGAGIWIEGDTVWQMHARPVEVGGVVHGAIAFGQAVRDELAAELRRETGNAIVIARGDRILAVSWAGGTPLGADGAAAVARATAGSSAPMELTVAGEPVLAVGVPFADDLRVSLVRSLEPALAARQRLTRVIGAIALAALALSLLVAVASARRLARPLDVLVGLAARIGEGRLGEQVEAGGVAEERALAAAMNDMAARLRHSHERLVLADRLSSVGTLAAGVAHEINNPLAYVTGNLHMLAADLRSLEGELGQGRLAEAHEMMNDTRDGVARICDIVRDLKVFSRTTVDEYGPIDVARVVKLAVNMTRHEVRQRAQLVVDVGEVPPVLGNEGRLGQVLVNLLVNAAHAIAEGDVEGNLVRIAAGRHDDGRVRLEVRDTGSGIPPELRRRIFDPFFTTKELGVGTGLGLSICHALVSAMGGEIALESEVGVGSTFTLLLTVAEELVPAAALATGSGPAPAGRRGRVLVVDDEPMIGAVIARALAGEHDVTVLTDGRAALATLDADRAFDVIFCDLMMPQLTGMDLHAELARRAPELIRRMVFLTGGAFTSQARTFMEQSASACFEKPLDLIALREIVRRKILQPDVA